MQCHEAEGLLEPAFSESLDSATQRELALHLESCPACRALLQQEYVFDRLIRTAVTHATPSAVDLVARIEQVLDGKRARRPFSLSWRRPALAFAAALLLVSAVALYRFNSSDPMHLLCQDAADDHRSEVVLNQPRPWRTGAQISDLAHRVVPNARIPQSVAGLPLEKARICGLLQARALHLVYGNQSQQISVFLMLQQELPSNSLPPPTAADLRLHEENDLGVSVTTFAGSGMGVAVVGTSGLTHNVAQQLLGAL